MAERRAVGRGPARAAPFFEPEFRAFVHRTDLALADDPGVIARGLHMVAVVEIA